MLCGYRSVMFGSDADGRRTRTTLTLSSDSDTADSREVMPPVRLPMLNVRPTSMLMRRFRSHPGLNQQEIQVAAVQNHHVAVAEVRRAERAPSSRQAHRQEVTLTNGHRQGSALDRLWQTDIETNRGFSVLPSKYGADRRGWDYSSTPSPPREGLNRAFKGSPTGRPILQPISGGHSHLQDGTTSVSASGAEKSTEFSLQDSRYPRLPPHREVLTIDKSPEPTGDQLNHTLHLAERCHLVYEKGGVGPSKPSTFQEKAANGRKPASSAPLAQKSEPGQRYSYHGDSPGNASLVPTPAHATKHRASNGGSDHLDRAFHAPSKHSNYSYSGDGHSESSDEDPNGITLSNTTRSKLKLLTKRNEMRRGMEREQQKLGAGHHHQDAAHERDERSRKFRELEKELSPGSVESRLAAARRNGQLTVRAANGPSLTSPRLTHPVQQPRRAVSHERPQQGRRPSHVGQHPPISSEKSAPLLPSPRIERKSGSMQNLATNKQKQPPLPKSKTFGAELNKHSLPSSASTVFGDHLERFANPKQALEEAHRKLNSDDWEREVSGLTDLVRLFRYHPDTLGGNELKAITAAIVKQMKNLRSQVLRAAVQTSAEMFQHVGKAVEMNMDKLVALLLQKTSDTNKFIKADSNRSLDVMLDSVTVPRAIVAVTAEGLGHRSSQVRTTVARLLSRLVQRLGAAGSLSGQKDVTDKLVPAAAQLVREGELQTRIHAKEIFQVWLQYPELDKVLGKYLSGSVKRDVDKVLDNLRNEGSKKKSSAPGKRGFGSRVRLNRTM